MKGKKSVSDSAQAVSRRRFLAQGTVATFSIMSAQTAFGSTANSRIKVGVIGLGGRGRMITGMVNDHGGYQIHAAADYFPDVAEDAGATFGVDKKRQFSGLSGYQHVLNSGVDAVFLETPPYCFPDHAKAAVDAGCHVYMAKPVACDVPGCVAVKQAAAKAGESERVFLIDFQTRTDPYNIEGVQRLHAGEIGPVCALNSRYTDDGFPDPPLKDTVEERLRGLIWVNDIHLGGGYLVNAGIHAVDVGMWMAQGHPASATGAANTTRKNPHGDSRDVYSVTYEFADGLIMNHRGEHVKNQHGFNCDCSAYCQDGYLDVTYGGDVVMRGAKDHWRGGEVKDLYRQGAIRNIATFHENVTEGITDNPTVEPSINATIATILGREAGIRRTRLTWEALLKENKRIEPDLTGLKA